MDENRLFNDRFPAGDASGLFVRSESFPFVGLWIRAGMHGSTGSIFAGWPVTTVPWILYMGS
jgi:hypothetical protein